MQPQNPSGDTDDRAEARLPVAGIFECAFQDPIGCLPKFSETTRRGQAERLRQRAVERPMRAQPGSLQRRFLGDLRRAVEPARPAEADRGGHLALVRLDPVG